MLVKCEISEEIAGVVSAAGPIDCTPAGFKSVQAEWKLLLGGAGVLTAAVFLLVLLADEALDGVVLVALLNSLGWA